MFVLWPVKTYEQAYKITGDKKMDSKQIQKVINTAAVIQEITDLLKLLPEKEVVRMYAYITCLYSDVAK